MDYGNTPIKAGGLVLLGVTVGWGWVIGSSLLLILLAVLLVRYMWRHGKKVGDK